MAGFKVKLEEYMGDYLEINHRETNSKTYSKILIDAISAFPEGGRACKG